MNYLNLSESQSFLLIILTQSKLFYSFEYPDTIKKLHNFNTFFVNEKNQIFNIES